MYLKTFFKSILASDHMINSSSLLFDLFQTLESSVSSLSALKDYFWLTTSSTCFLSFKMMSSSLDKVHEVTKISDEGVELSSYSSCSETWGSFVAGHHLEQTQ